MPDYGTAVVQTRDGGYIISGVTDSNDGDVTFNHGFTDYWLLKLNDKGDLQWQKTYGGTYYDIALSVIETYDGGYLMGGHTYNFDGDVRGFHGWADCWVVKTDSVGNIKWQHALGGSKLDVPACIIQTSDSGFAMTATTTSGDGDVTDHYGGYDAWIVKLDKYGEIAWQKSFGGSKADNPGFIFQTSDENYLTRIACNSKDGNLTHLIDSGVTVILKIDSGGTLLWNKNIGRGKGDYVTKAIPLPGNEFMLFGSMSLDSSSVYREPLRNFWLVKMNGSGKLEWQRQYGGALNDLCDDAILTKDGNFIAAGVTTSLNGDVKHNHGSKDGWIIKLNNEGKLMWEESIGGTKEDEIRAILQTSDGGFLLVGDTKSSDGDVHHNNGNADLWVVKLKPERNQ